MKMENASDLTLVEVLKKIDIRYRITFCGTMLFGLLAQGLGLFNEFSWHDDIGLFGVGATTTSGRWMLEICAQAVGRLFGEWQFSLPLFNGTIGLFFIALTACLIVAVLDIRSQGMCLFTGGLLAVFPVVTATFAFVYTLPYYAFSVALGAFGAWCLCKMKKPLLGGILGVICIGCSLGIYQAYLPLTLCILLFYLIGCAVKEDTVSAAALIKRSFLFGLEAIAALLFYLGMNKLMLKLQHLQLSSYLSLDTMGKSSPAGYLKRAAQAYREFLLPDRDSLGYMFPGSLRVLYFATLFLGGLLALRLIVRTYRKDRVKGLWAVLLFLLVPLAANFIIVMAGKEIVGGLMVYAQAMPFVLFAWMLEGLSLPAEKLARCLKTAGLAVLLFVNVMYCRYDNKCYLKTTLRQQQAISYFTTLITRIKSTEGYRDELPVSFLNTGEIQDESLQEIEALRNTQLTGYGGGATAYVNDYNWLVFMNFWCGYWPTVVDGDDIVSLPEVEEMPSYPDDGSIKVIDERVVVKF